MSATSLQNKTIRPGSLMSYSYYHSVRRPVAAGSGGAARTMPQFSKAPLPRVSHVWRKRLAVTFLILAALVVLPLVRGGSGPTSMAANEPTIPAGSSAAAVSQPAITSNDPCTGNTLDQAVLVSIGRQHLWACQTGKSQYDSPVITGMAAHESTVTPAGTYRIYDKQTDTTLTGSDETGSWSDPVKYWMPFLNNKFGTYGFHDATWRPNDSFGKVSPSSSNASHGCVELPLSTSAWLYNWARVGTTVKIEN